MQLSALISKPTLSKEGKPIGYVKNVYIGKNKNSLSALICVDGEEEEFTIPARSVSFGKDIVVGSARCSSPSGFPCPVGKSVYSSLGERLGTAREYTLCDEGAFLTAEKEGVKTNYPAARLVIGEIVVVYPAKKTPRSQRAARPTEPCGHCLRAPSEQPLKDCKQCGETGKDALYASNLLGKPLKRELKNESGTLAAAGERVTPSMIREAAKQNRLLALCATVLGD